MLFTPEPPIVIKVGSAEAGYGKVRIKDADDIRDFKGCLALHNDYATVEPYIADREYDIRVQRIGNHIRAYKRIGTGWKGNVGSSSIESIPVTDKFRAWTDEVAKLFGGMDIFTVDAIHTKGDRDIILEINDTASGFLKENELEDQGYVLDIVAERMAADVTTNSLNAAPVRELDKEAPHVIGTK